MIKSAKDIMEKVVSDDTEVITRLTVFTNNTTLSPEFMTPLRNVTIKDVLLSTKEDVLFFSDKEAELVAAISKNPSLSVTLVEVTGVEGDDDPAYKAKEMFAGDSIPYNDFVIYMRDVQAAANVQDDILSKQQVDRAMNKRGVVKHVDAPVTTVSGSNQSNSFLKDAGFRNWNHVFGGKEDANE